MKVKMILPALAEAESPFWRPIKYSLFPPLGLATLAAYLPSDAEIDLQDQHVETLRLDDTPVQQGCARAYREFYSWKSIFRSSLTHPSFSRKWRHLLYTSGWKKFEPFWNFLIKTHSLHRMLPLLESMLETVKPTRRRSETNGLDRELNHSPRRNFHLEKPAGHWMK
jgi:hypothetical protein